MSIAAIGSIGPHMAVIVKSPTPSASRKPESSETPGASEHDGDTDNSGASAARASSSKGHVDVKA